MNSYMVPKYVMVPTPYRLAWPDDHDHPGQRWPWESTEV